MRCTSCMAVNPATNRFCGACGTMLAAVRHAAEGSSAPASSWGELKQATVLFADIVSSTEHIATLDAEQAMDRLQPALRRMCDAVESFGGTVVRTLGDGVMALFGVPMALEGHARLACEAALRMQQDFGSSKLDWRIRVGLHSGQVAWDPANADGVRGGGVHGLAIHIASRVVGAAEPGSIFLTQGCVELARPECDAVSMGPHSLKGLPVPVHLHRLVGMKPLSVAYARSGHSALSSFRGRDRELGALHKALQLASQGEARVVGISGEPGAGKSRLCMEFASECRSGQIPVFEIRTQLYGRATPLQPVLELLRTYFFGIPAGEDASGARARIAECMAAIRPLDDADLAVIYEFLGVIKPGSPASPLNPKARHARLLSLVRELVAHRAAILSLLIIEDLHWLDEASEQFVAQLVDAVAGTRTMLVLNYRPLYRPVWASAPSFVHLEMGELGIADTDALVRELMGFRPRLDDICNLVVKRSGGNPFFAEELVRSLDESGALEGNAARSAADLLAIERSLPLTVHAIIAARIDHLHESEKALLQMCAIIGKEVPRAVLQHVAGLPGADIEQALAGLAAAALIHAAPSGSAADIAFRHPLIQEVAYSSQLKARRGPLHAAVAGAMELHFAGRIDEFAALVAYHFEAAGHSVDAANYESRAARWIGTTDSALAIKHWRKVRSLLQEQPATAPLDRLRAIAGGQIGILGWRQGLTLSEVQPIIQEAAKLADGADHRLVQLLHIVEGRMLVGCGGAADAYVDFALKAKRIGHAGDHGRNATIDTFLSQAYGWAGLLKEALAANDRAMAMLEHIDQFDRDFIGFSIDHWVLGMRSRLLIRIGRFDEARQHLQAMLDSGPLDPTVLIIAHYGSVDLAACLGDARMAQVHATAALELADRHDIQYVRVLALGSCAAARMIAGDAVSALQYFEQALQLVRQANAALEFETEVLAGLAECHLQLGDAALAVDVARETVALSRERSTRLTEIRALIVLGAALPSQGHSGAFAAARECMDQAMALVEQTGARIFDGVLEREKARLGNVQGADPQRGVAKMVNSRMP